MPECPEPSIISGSCAPPAAVVAAARAVVVAVARAAVAASAASVAVARVASLARVNAEEVAVSVGVEAHRAAAAEAVALTVATWAVGKRH